MSRKKIIGITLGVATGLTGAFAGGMVLSNNLKDDNYTVVIAEKQEEITTIANSLENLNKDIESKEAEITLLKVSNKNLEDEKTSLQTQLDEKITKITQVEKQLSDLQISSSEEIETLNSQKETLETEKTDLQTQLTEKETEITRLNGVVTGLENQLSELRSSYSELQTSYNNLQTQYNELVATSNVDKQQIEALNATITDLNSQIDSFRQQILDLESQINKDPEKIYLSDFLSFDKGISLFEYSDERLLGFKDGNFYSVNTVDFSITEVNKVGDFDIPDTLFKSSRFIQKNGNLLMYYFGIYLYNYNDNSITRLVNFGGESIRTVFEFEDGTVITSTQSQYSNPHCFIVLPDYTLKNYKYHSVKFLGRSGKNALFQGVNSESSLREFLLYNSETHDFEILTDDVPSFLNYEIFGHSLRNGDLFISAKGPGGLCFFDSSEKRFSLIREDLSFFDFFFETTKGKVLCKGSVHNSLYPGGLWVFDIETQGITQLSSLYDFSSFNEDENGVMVVNSTTKYYYDFATGSFAVMES